MFLLLTFTEEFAVLLKLVSLFTCTVIATRRVNAQAIYNITAAIVHIAFVFI